MSGNTFYFKHIKYTFITNQKFANNINVAIKKFKNNKKYTNKSTYLNEL